MFSPLGLNGHARPAPIGLPKPPSSVAPPKLEADPDPAEGDVDRAWSRE
jgi:hypothetical protein